MKNALEMMIAPQARAVAANAAQEYPASDMANEHRQIFASAVRRERTASSLERDVMAIALFGSVDKFINALENAETEA